MAATPSSERQVIDVDEPAEQSGPSHAMPPHLPRISPALTHLINTFTESKRLFGPLKEAFFEWCEQPNMSADFGQILDHLAAATLAGPSFPSVSFLVNLSFSF